MTGYKCQCGMYIYSNTYHTCMYSQYTLPPAIPITVPDPVVQTALIQLVEIAQKEQKMREKLFVLLDRIAAALEAK